MKALIFCLAMSLVGTSAFAADDDGIGVTYDIGASSGKDTNDRTYSEVNVGLNLQKSFVEWRNAVFGRFISGQENIYGLDTSLHGVLEDQSGETIGYRFFAGPGYRFVTKGDNLPFAEAGLVVRLGGISVGGGAKAFFNELVDKNQKNETQYFIILGGGGRL